MVTAYRRKMFFLEEVSAVYLYKTNMFVCLLIYGLENTSLFICWSFFVQQLLLIAEEFPKPFGPVFNI